MTRTNNNPKTTRSVKRTSISTAVVLGLMMASPAVLADSASDVNFKFSGYIKVDSMFSSYDSGTLSSGNLGRDFYIPGLTPVGGVEESTQFDMHARQSRFRFTADTLVDGEKITGVLEFDMQATPNGDERVSNSYSPRVRHAFLKYGNWLFGQTWSTFQDVTALPETLDFIGVTDGTIFVRQSMIRYSNNGFEIALENPETTVTPYGGGGRIVTDDNSVPDLIARYTHKADWGHVAVAGMVRQLAYQSGDVIDASETGYGISITSKIKLGADDLRLMFNTGSGLGRYLGINAANGAVLNAANELEAIDSYGYAIAYRHVWNDQWRSTLTYSKFQADNDVSLTGTGVTESTYSTHVNLLYSPNKKITFGAEYGYANRTLENDAEGDMNRIQLSAKYAF